MTENQFCRYCGSPQSVSQVVVSRGNPKAKLMLIGEAPGSMEEVLGLPFVGRSGTVLNGLLQSVGIDPDKDVFITNVVKCRPPQNRRPTKSEISSCLPWLNQQIKLVDPLVIVLTGSTAVEATLNLKTPISLLRGTWQNWEGRFVMPVFHPSYLLRNPSKAEGRPKALTISDFQEVREKLNSLSPNSFMPNSPINKWNGES